MNYKPTTMIRPSGSHIWAHCHAAQVMQESEPDDDSDASREGTASHWLACEIGTAYITQDKELKTSGGFIGQLAPNGVLIDEEMYQGAIDYITDIMKYCNATGLLQSVNFENKLNLSSIYFGMEGTPDSWVYNPKKPEIVLWDYKYGYGHVEVYENPQLIIYVAGILDLLKIDGISDQQLVIRMRIFQPRSYHSNGPMREWAILASDLRPYINKLKHVASRAMSEEGQCIPGEHCHHCLATHNCAAFIKTVYNYFDVITGPEKMNMKGNNLALELKLLNRMTELLKYRRSAVSKQVEHEIKQGELLPGFIQIDNYGNLRWKKDTPTDQVLMMGDLLGVDLRKPDKLDTPTQSFVKFKNKSRELGVTLDESVIKQYTEKPYLGKKVIPDDGIKIRLAFTKEI